MRLIVSWGILVAAFLALGSVGRAAAQANFLTWTDSQKEEFLQAGEVVREKELGVGITRSLRLTLRHDGVEHDAHFQAIDVRKAVERTTAGLQAQFADSYKFNIAGYRLDRLLGLNMAPPSIERRYGQRLGAFTWWVDGVLMMEKDRFTKRIAPPDDGKWNDQMHRARVFTELIYNTDPNLGNILITAAWKIKLIDFTRAFRPFGEIRAPENLLKIDRDLLRALRELDPAEVQEVMADVLTRPEIDALLQRRDLVAGHFADRVAELGEEQVLY